MPHENQYEGFIKAGSGRSSQAGQEAASDDKAEFQANWFSAAKQSLIMACGGRPVATVRCTEMGERTVRVAEVNLQPTETSKADGVLHNQNPPSLVYMPTFHHG